MTWASFFSVDIGPEWMFFRLRKAASQPDPAGSLSELVWEVAQQHQLYQMVVELEPETILTSYLIGQLVLWHKRCHLAGGVLRICAFSTDMYSALEVMRLDERFPNYRSREDAVMGYKPD